MSQYLEFQFNLAATETPSVTSESLKSQKFILYVYPKDNTSACTLEANEFANLYEEFKKTGFEVYGISKDTLNSHHKFKDKFNLPFPLIADPEKILLEGLDVFKEKKMYGKTVMGTIRSTFVFDKELKLIKEFRDVKAPGHAQFILDFVKSL